jgi:hypothetical protein
MPVTVRPKNVTITSAWLIRFTIVNRRIRYFTAVSCDVRCLRSWSNDRPNQRIECRPKNPNAPLITMMKYHHTPKSTGLRSRSRKFACGSNWANRAVLRGWHSRQVSTRLSPYSRDSGSLIGRMSCAPWQSEHVAARAEPSAVTCPW